MSYATQRQVRGLTQRQIIGGWGAGLLGFVL